MHRQRRSSLAAGLNLVFSRFPDVLALSQKHFTRLSIARNWKTSQKSSLLTCTRNLEMTRTTATPTEIKARLSPFAENQRTALPHQKLRGTHRVPRTPGRSPYISVVWWCGDGNESPSQKLKASSQRYCKLPAKFSVPSSHSFL